MRVCLIAPLANVLLGSGVTGVYGGSEIRAWMLARGLARSGAQLSLIVQGDSTHAVTVHSGVHVVRHDFNRPAGRATHLARILGAMRRTSSEGDMPMLLRQLNPSIVCAFGAALFNAQLAETCRRQGRRFVLFLGSDIDVAGTVASVLSGRPLEAMPPRPDALTALKAADLVVAQTEWQAQRVQAVIGRDAPVVPSPIDMTDANLPVGHERRTEVLWVGKTDEIKRPRLALATARLCPEHSFRIVANPTTEDAWRMLNTEAATNVTLVRSFPYEQSDAVYKKAFVLLNTSAFEGFPSAFLQAGRCGVPIVSAAVDPDGILERTKGGVLAGPDPTSLASAIREMAADPDMWSDRSMAMFAYVRCRHTLETCVSQLMRCFDDLEGRGIVAGSVDR